MKDYKNSNDYNDKFTNRKKKRKEVKSDKFVKENQMIKISKKY